MPRTTYIYLYSYVFPIKGKLHVLGNIWIIIYKLLLNKLPSVKSLPICATNRNFCLAFLGTNSAYKAVLWRYDWSFLQG